MNMNKISPYWNRMLSLRHKANIDLTIEWTNESRAMAYHYIACYQAKRLIPFNEFFLQFKKNNYEYSINFVRLIDGETDYSIDFANLFDGGLDFSESLQNLFNND